MSPIPAILPAVRPSTDRTGASAASGQRCSLPELVEETQRIVVAAMETPLAGFTVPLKVGVKGAGRGRTANEGVAVIAVTFDPVAPRLCR